MGRLFDTIFWKRNRMFRSERGPLDFVIDLSIIVAVVTTVYVIIVDVLL